MRSFAFSSIQDQRAELEREAEEGRDRLSCYLPACLSACLPFPPSSRATQFQSGADRCSPNLTDRQQDRQRDARAPLLSKPALLSSSPPPSSRIWLGFFLVCFCHSLGVFLVWVYFWYPLTKVWRLLPSLKCVPPFAPPSTHMQRGHSPFSGGSE